MKKLLLAFSCIVSFARAQHQHPCSVSKINNSNHVAVAGTALTNLENKYDLKFYHLNINIERNTTFISGNVRCLATVKSLTLDSFGFELHSNHTIDSVILNGINVPVSRNVDEARVAFPTPITQGTLFDATVYYHGTAPTGASAAIGDGYSTGTSGSWGNEVTWSLSESYVAYEWFPCKQQLQDKIDSSWVFATTDSSNKVGSNGLLKNVVTVGNKKRYEWKSNHPIDYYLISVACAQYVEYNIYAHPQAYAPDSVLIQNYVYNNPSTLPYFKSVIDSTKQLIEVESQLYGLYPWSTEKYGHCMAPFGGGMEHQTMTSLGYFDFSVVAHELGHQWWGDMVTCRTWHDIFINEGFASYTEQLVLEYLEPTQAKPQMLQVHNNVMSQPGGSVWNPDTTNMNRVFDSRLSYDKGSAILHSLRFVINDDSVFFKGLRNYGNQYKYSTASIDDFKNSMAAFSGMNFDQFFNQWIYGEGYPTFNVRWNQPGGTGTQLILKSAQTVSSASITPLFITPVEYTIHRNIGDTIIRVMHNVATEYYYLNMPGTVTGIVVDPNNWILNKVVGPTHDLTLVDIATFDHSNAINVYPNPATNQVKVSGCDNAGFVLMDVSGKIILSVKVTGTESLDLSGLAKGMYLYRITGENHSLLKTGKLAVQ
ncbi:MAG: M1 family aminopeptidase [Bacteroidia bacterium]